MRTIRSVLSAAVLVAAGAVFAAPAGAEEEVTVTSCDDPSTDCFGPPDIGGPCEYDGNPGTVNEDGLCICAIPEEDEEAPEPEPGCEECEEADAPEEPEPAPEDDQQEPESQPAAPTVDAPASSTSPAPSAAPVAGQPTMTG